LSAFFRKPAVTQDGIGNLYALALEERVVRVFRTAYSALAPKPDRKRLATIRLLLCEKPQAVFQRI
jgi:hypothetical protein